MNAKILNREGKHPEDGFYQIEAKGYHPARLGKKKVVQVIDDKAIAAMANRFKAEAAAGELRHGNEMLVDREHFSGNPDKETTAYAWMEDADARPDGIYARNRWTPTGKAAVDGQEYRFFSTEYDPADLEDVPASEVPEAVRNKFKGARFVRPLRLDGLTLTNMPNNRGQKPITNRQPTDLLDEPADVAADEQADKTRIQNSMKQIATKLGLSADASEDAIVGELGKILNRATTAEANLATVTTERDTLRNRMLVIDGEIIDADLDAAGITDEAIRNKVKPVLLKMSNRDERVDFIGLMHKPAAEKPGKTAQVKLLNRDGKKPGDAQADTGDDQEKAEKIRNRAEELHGAAPMRGFDSCWRQAQREVLGGARK
jgi:phage I-like protein